MLDHIPTKEELKNLLGEKQYQVWEGLAAAIGEKYEMDCVWNSGGKAWTYEYKYRKGQKTLCCLYARDGCCGCMIILGGAEREKFESERELFSEKMREIYDSHTTYHDGKWLMIQSGDLSLLEDVMNLLLIKRKPNRKAALA